MSFLSRLARLQRISTLDPTTAVNVFSPKALTVETFFVAGACILVNEAIVYSFGYACEENKKQAALYQNRHGSRRTPQFIKEWFDKNDVSYDKDL